MTSLLTLEELIKELITKVDILLEQKVQTTDYQDAVAAKIIQDITEKLDRCECTEKLFEKLKGEPLVEKIKKEKTFDLHKYSYPNFDVGNASLGSSENPNAMTWPFGTKK